MNAIVDASQSIVDALSTVAGLTVTTDPGASLSSFPAAVVSVPQLNWDDAGFGQDTPSGATFVVFVIVKSDGQILSSLSAAVTAVVAALWTVEDLVPTQALTGTFPQGAEQLPCYIVTAEVSL